MITIPPALEPMALEWMAQTLQARGAMVTWPEDLRDWETMSAALERLWETLPGPRPTIACLRSRLGSPSCPDFPCTRHPSGRLKRLVMTPELVRFLSQPIQPGDAL